jgi:hypothetical protein
MKQEYRIAKGWAIFIWITLPLFMGLFGWLGIMPYVQEEFDLIMAIVFTPLSIGLEFLMVLGLIDIVKSKWIIENNTITAVRVFKTRQFKVEEIRGFKQDQNYLHFIPKDSQVKRIKVSTYVGKFGQLIDWSENNLTNLDREEVITDEREILENEEYGRTSEEREYKLSKARKLTKTLNTASWIIGLSTWIYPHFYQIQIVLCAILPIVGLIVYKTSKGLIKLDEKPNSAHPNIISTLIAPSGALAMRALMDFQIFDLSNFWKPAIAIFVIFGLLVLKDSNVQYDFRKGVTYLAILGLLMFGGMYSYGFLITTNVVFDESQPSAYKAEILDKRISSGKTTTYYFELSKWGPKTEIDDVSVSKEIYNSREIGDSAVVYFNHGLYKIPYYFVIQ